MSLLACLARSFMALGFEYIGVKVVVSMSVRVVTVSYTKSLIVVVYVGVTMITISLDGAVVVADDVKFSVCVVVAADGLVTTSVVTMVDSKAKIAPVAVYPSNSEHQSLQLFEDMIDLAALAGSLGVGKLGTGSEEVVLAAELAALVIALEFGDDDGLAPEGIIGIREKPRELVKPIGGAVGATLGDRSEPDDAP